MLGGGRDLALEGIESVSFNLRLWGGSMSLVVKTGSQKEYCSLRTGEVS